MQGRLVDSEKKNSIQYFPEKNWTKEFQIAKKISFSFMEWTINKENIKKNPIYNGDLKKLREIKKKYNVSVNSITNDFFMQKPFFKERNLKKRNKILEILQKIIINGNKIGIKHHVFPLVDNSSVKSKKQEKILIQGIKILLEKLNKKSQILFETDYKPDEIIRFIKKFRNKKIGINYDTGNSASLGYNFSDEIKYFKYVKNIHIKDRVLNGKSVRLGKGNWNHKKFFELIKGKYKGNFILQTARNPHNEHIKEMLINKKFLIKNGYK